MLIWAIITLVEAFIFFVIGTSTESEAIKSICGGLFMVSISVGIMCLLWLLWD